MAQWTVESKEAMRLRTIGSRMAERPSTDGGPAIPAHMVPRQGWRREPMAQRIVESMDAMGSMDGRAGVSGRSRVAPWIATGAPTAIPRRTMARYVRISAHEAQLHAPRATTTIFIDHLHHVRLHKVFHRKDPMQCEISAP